MEIWRGVTEINRCEGMDGDKPDGKVLNEQVYGDMTTLSVRHISYFCSVLRRVHRLCSLKKFKEASH